MYFVFRLLFVLIPASILWALSQTTPLETLTFQGFSHEDRVLFLTIVFITFFIRNVFSQKKFSQFFIFIDTLEHEFSHILIGFFHLKTPGELKVNNRGSGHITLNNISTFICLAPYIFPLWSLLLYLSHFLFKPEIQPMILGLSALFLGNYFFRLKREIHRGQSDFEIAGFYISMLSIFFINLCWLSILLLNFLQIADYSTQFSRLWQYFQNFLTSVFSG